MRILACISLYSVFICLLTCSLFHPLYPYPSSYLPTSCLIIAHPPTLVHPYTYPFSHHIPTQSPVVRYGHPEEISSLVVISNLCAYIYHITAPERWAQHWHILTPIHLLLTLPFLTPSYSHHPEKWLQLMATHPLEKLVYIDIDFGYQYLRVEFCLPGACYSFLMRDEEKCTTCSSRLACEIPPSNITSNAKKISSWN